jgi:hypothetical protein
MDILPYGNPELEPVTAEWEGIHYVEEGIATTEGQVENIVEGSIESALTNQPGRRRRRRG